MTCDVCLSLHVLFKPSQPWRQCEFHFLPSYWVVSFRNYEITEYTRLALLCCWEGTDHRVCPLVIISDFVFRSKSKVSRRLVRGNICNRNSTKVCPRMLACRRACPRFRLGRCCATVTPWPTDDRRKHSQQEWARMPNGDHAYMRKTACFQPLRCLLSEDSYRIRRFSCRHQHRNVQWLWWHRCCASPSLTKSQPRGRRWLCVLLLAMGNW